MSRPSHYAAHADFIAPARGTMGMRPVILGFIIVESLYQIGLRLLGLGLQRLDPALANAARDGDTALGLLINLGSFILFGLCIALVVQVVHGRSVASLLGPAAGFMAQFRSTFVHVALLFLAIEALFGGFVTGPDATIRPLAGWLLLLGPALVALLIQTGSEELFYRGYLQQRIAVLMPHPAAWLILPNIAFALAHWDGYAPMIENAAYVLWAFFFGLAASDLTARAGNLGPAMALHLANNAYAFLFFAEKGGVDSGLALVLFDPASVPIPPADNLLTTGLPGELMLLALTWAAARLAIAR
jgi:membrane protease YdiL (CAAX protease family)